jgi:hypothetical protein
MKLGEYIPGRCGDNWSAEGVEIGFPLLGGADQNH